MQQKTNKIKHRIMIKYFGTTLNETVFALTGVHLGTPPQSSFDGQQSNSDKSRARVRLIVSIFLCMIGAYLIIGEKKVTEGVALLTLVGGYWLK
jgi:hypothetical protein